MGFFHQPRGLYQGRVISTFHNAVTERQVTDKHRERPDENKERLCIRPYHYKGYDEGNDHACEEREIEEFRSGPFD